MRRARVHEKRRRFRRWRVTRMRYEGSLHGKFGISFRPAVSPVCLLYPMISITLFRPFNAPWSKRHSGTSIRPTASADGYICLGHLFSHGRSLSETRSATTACQMINTPLDVDCERDIVVDRYWWDEIAW